MSGLDDLFATGTRLRDGLAAAYADFLASVAAGKPRVFLARQRGDCTPFYSEP